MTPKLINTFISSANRSTTDSVCDFDVDFTDDLIKCNQDQYIRVNVISFDMLNSMYNINETNNTFYIIIFNVVALNPVFNERIEYKIPVGNYSVISLKKWLNDTLTNNLIVSYNVAQNSFNFNLSNQQNNLSTKIVYLYPTTCSKILGINSTNLFYGLNWNGANPVLININNLYGMEYLVIFDETNTADFENVFSYLGKKNTNSYVNLVNYNKVILRTKNISYDMSCIENVKTTTQGNKLTFSDILFWVSKQDVEPFRNICYNNNDGGNSFNVMLHDKFVNKINLQLTNEYNELITDAPDFLLVLQFSIHNKEEWFKTTLLQIADNIKQIFVMLLWIAENYLNII